MALRQTKIEQLVTETQKSSKNIMNLVYKMKSNKNFDFFMEPEINVAETQAKP